MEKISVVLADDHAVVRQGLRALIEAEPDMRVAGEADCGVEAIRLARELKPDVVIMDVVMPRLNGIQATRDLVKQVPDARVLVLSTYSDEQTVSQMMRAGAVGYLAKRTASEDLLRAIREVRAGRQFFSASIAQAMRQQQRRATGGGTGPRRSLELTPRETEVLQLIAEGFANKQMADRLGISVKTIEKHRQQVMNKLGIHDTAGLTRAAITRGLVPQEFTAPV